jgi:Family of unknown function (DUF6121)
VSELQPSPVPPRDGRIAPVLVTVVYGALLVAGWGFTSLILDQDVIIEKDAGPLLGPVMVCSACLVVWTALWGLRNRRSAGRTVVAAAALVYLVMLLFGALIYTVARGELAAFLLFVGHYAPSPFLIEPPILAAITVVGFWLAGTRSLPGESFDRDRPGD